MVREAVAGQAKRLADMENRDAVRATLNRYMDLCDVPREAFQWDEMAELFTPDAVWEGIGPEYTGKFGRLDGRDSILSMLAQYLPPALHFKRNLHLLGSGQITTGGTTGTGRWVMQQLSEYESGRTEVIGARLSVDFHLSDGQALITHFRTEKVIATDLSTTAINA
ncbi:nuclear transport factor 2 family protein [Paenarthrobacter sp. YIM B13468]|uniref:nuclear transport factor 2 family protein n=1 Tax=Paenarthrobacter sp. YIM B13468 TaxID=3366295 RepID=UPI00366D770C